MSSSAASIPSIGSQLPDLIGVTPIITPNRKMNNKLDPDIRRRTLKILYIVESLDNGYGGPARSVPSIALSIKDSHGVNSVLLSVSKSAGEKNEVIDNSDLSWIQCSLSGPKKLMFSYEMYKKMIDPEFVSKFNVIHLNNIWNFPALLAWYSAKKFKIPLIISPRGSIYKWSLSQGYIYKKIALTLYQKTMLKQAALIHVTDISETDALRDLGVRTKCIVIPNGINSPRDLSDSDRAGYALGDSINDGRRKILFVGRIHRKKGIDLLISAFCEISREFPDWDLHIVGRLEENDDYVNNIKKLIFDSAASSRVFLHGEFIGSKKISAFKNSNLFVLPSHSENFGISVAEAMAYSLPVITTNNTPWKCLGVIEAGWSIDLSKDNLKNALKNALSLDNKTLKAMGKKGQNYIKRYNWKILSGHYNRMYLAVTGSP